MKKLNPVNLTAESVDNMLSFETLSEMNKSLILGGYREDESESDPEKGKCNKCEYCDKCKAKCGGCSAEENLAMSPPYLLF